MPKTIDTTPLPSLDEAGLVTVDIDRLIVTKLLATASSGGGKSWLLRRLLEVTHGLVQQIVFDYEGEFHTLREKYDYILVGPGGDCPADLRSAALLATRLLELGVSAIIDLSDLGVARAEYVKRFIVSMMDAPRDLWHPVMVVVDECHKFCPERGAGEAVSDVAIKDLATRGRKRGFCLVAATQRISELHKTVIAECGNKLIGRTGLDLDIDRARRPLGMSAKKADEALPHLGDGEFYAFGSALCRQVTLIKVGPVATTHPTAGQRQLPPTPPRARVKQILAQLANLPQEAEKELRTVSELQARVRELETTALLPLKAGDLVVLRTEHDRVLAAMDETIDGLKAELEDTKRWAEVQGDIIEECSRSLDRLADDAVESRNAIGDRMEQHLAEQDTVGTPIAVAPELLPGTGNGIPSAPPVTRAPKKTSPPAESTETGDGAPMSAMQRASLIAAVMHPNGVTKAKIRLVTGYAASGKLGQAWAKLTSEGWWVSEDSEHYSITGEGLAALGTWTRLPIGRDLRQKLLAETSKLSGMERAILDQVCQEYPRSITRAQVRVRTGYAASGKLGQAFAMLLTAGYVTSAGAEGLTAAAELFDPAESGMRTTTPEELRTSLITRLPPMESALLQVICSRHPDTVTRTYAREQAGYAPSGKIGQAFASLLASKYIEADDGGVRASAELF